MATFKAGAGRAVLAFPKEYFPTEGYNGIHDDMHVRVLLMESGEVRTAVAVFELSSVRPWELTDSLRAYTAEKLGTAYENTWAIVTHDLSAPHVPVEEEKRSIHMNTLKAALDEAAAAALESFRPAKVGYGEGLSDVNANRDVQSVDGWWVGIEGKGPSDKTLSVVKIDGVDGKPIAVLYSYALKSSLLETAPMSDGWKYASGDVTGVACTRAEEATGAVTIFVMGAAGDQVPKIKGNYLTLNSEGKFVTVNLYEKAYDGLSLLGNTLGDDVISLVNGTECTDEEPELAVMESSLAVNCKKPYPKTLPEPPVLTYEYEPCGEGEITLYSMRIGEAAFMALKSEVTTPIFTEIKRNSPFKHNLMATLANGGQGYIATDSDYERFTYPGLHTDFVKGTDRQFTSFVTEELTKLKNL